MTEPGGVGTPGTEALRAAIYEQVGDDYPLLSLLVNLEDAIEAEATRAERERIVRAVERLPEASHQRVGPKGWRHVAKDAVLAILGDEP